MNKKYVLIDYENIQPADMQALDRDSFHVIVFVGANQTKVTYTVAEVEIMADSPIIKAMRQSPWRYRRTP